MSASSTASLSSSGNFLKLIRRRITCSARSVSEANFWRDKPQARRVSGSTFRKAVALKFRPTAFCRRAKIVPAALP